ncbi:MAG: YbaK/EbsC family protein [Acidimicrobiia bacterium]|nr:YbaK/EbsC family protein [Acidimicrobiia bacterium]
MTGLPDAARRVTAWAAERGVDLDVRVHPDGTRTADDAAAAVGCEVGAIVKSLVFVVDGAPVVALVPGDRRLDPGKLAAAVGGGRAERADLETVRAATGFAAGGTPPFAHATDVPVVADPGLRRHAPVWAAAGTPTTVFPMDPDRLASLAGAEWRDVSEGDTAE